MEEIAGLVMISVQLHLAIGVPVLLNERFNSNNQRFDDMRDLWRSELLHVEEIPDVRLKYLQERRG